MDTSTLHHDAPSLRLDPALAHDLADRLALPTATSVDALGDLVMAMARSLPVGTVAKHEATARNELPPGADADACARAALAGLDDPQPDSPLPGARPDTPLPGARPDTPLPGARPRPDAPSWTCWVHTTLCKALVESRWGWRSDIVATRNLDGRVPVDFHSVVEVHAPDGLVVLDPLFAIGPVPVGATAGPPAWRARVDVEADGRRACRWATPGGVDARYRSVSGPLDADDITAFLHISTRYTGMSARRWWRIAGPRTCSSITDDADAGPLLKRYTHTDEGWQRDERFCENWIDATTAAIAHVWNDETHERTR